MAGGMFILFRNSKFIFHSLPRPLHSPTSLSVSRPHTYAKPASFSFLSFSVDYNFEADSASLTLKKFYIAKVIFKANPRLSLSSLSYVSFFHIFIFF